MPKPMTPFREYAERLCDNPDCKLGPNGTRRQFKPNTPWQDCCEPACRQHRNYLRRKAEKESGKSDA